MSKIITSAVRLLCGIIGKRNAERLLIYSAKAIDVNLHRHGLIQIGALNGFDHENNGEQFFIENVLTQLIPTDKEAVFFDVGANVGDYSLALRKAFPLAAIYAFEPVKGTFDILATNTVNSNIITNNIGLSDENGTGTLYNTVNNTNTQIASLYKDVFAEVFDNNTELEPVSFQMETIDSFCERQDTSTINFLKIDVEGHELFVLKGAKNRLLNSGIKVIQFEFNTHNLYSKVGLHDFYQLLTGFQFYRLHQNTLISLGDYSPVNEIFTAQNIIAIHKDEVKHLDGKHYKYYA